MGTRPQHSDSIRRRLGGRLTPVVTWLLVIELTAFIVYAFADGPAFYRDHLALTPARTLPNLEVWQLVTALFFPVAGGALLGNLIGLFFIGPLLERPWGSRRFLTVFLVSGIAANLTAALVGLWLAPTRATGGCTSSLVALTVAFGFVYRRQQLLFFGVAPMRAVHLSVFFTALVAGITAGVIGALAATERLPLDGVGDRVARWWRASRRARLKRRYKVLTGGKGDEPKRYVN
jgi:membrane associated rhomboid family serine protease